MKYLIFFLIFYINISAQADSSVVVATDSLTLANDSLMAINDSIKSIQNNFIEFEYSEVITKANKLIQQKEKLNQQQLIELLKMKGISHYSLAEDQAARSSFIEILRTDSTFNFDSTKTSPKILTFFNDVREAYQRQLLNEQTSTVVRIDTVIVSQSTYNYELERKIKQAVFRSMLLPGLGHLYMDYNTKGWLLSVLSTISLGSMIYFISDTNDKELKYLESRGEEITASYKSYNKSYQIRNISIVAYSAIWLYTQIDLLFFSDESYNEDSNIKVDLINDSRSDITFGIKLTL